MPSLIAPHFPVARMEGNQKLWFNPVQKIRAADRPEERVRLQMIEFLSREAGFSLNHITTELPVKLHREDTALRADILCFDDFLRPLLLIECKSPQIQLDEKTAMQAAKYNMQVKSPYLMLTNGVRDLLYAVHEDGSVSHVPDFSQIFPLQQESTRFLNYWSDRHFIGKLPANDGFSGKNPPDSTTIANAHFDYLTEMSNLENYLTRFYRSDAASNQYVQVTAPKPFQEFTGFTEIDHFFRVYRPDDGSVYVAFGFYGHPGITTRLICINISPEKKLTWLTGKVSFSKNKLEIKEVTRVRTRDSEVAKSAADSSEKAENDSENDVTVFEDITVLLDSDLPMPDQSLLAELLPIIE